LFLVGFFLTIGLSGLPDITSLGISILFTLLLPFKIILFFLLLTRFKFRAQTATLTSFNLANYSEFGLIVGAAGVSGGLINPEWMVIFALALSLTFIIASPLNLAAQKIFLRMRSQLIRFETEKHLPEDEPIELGNAEVVILGMGRTGTAVFDVMKNKYDFNLLGIDQSLDSVAKHLSAQRNVIHGEADDIEFWQRIQPSSKLRMIIMATSKHATHMEIIKQIEKNHNNITFAALSRYEDEMEELKQAGVQIVFNLYTEAGAGYAEHIFRVFNNKQN
jgi:hypothetical protein